MGIFDTSEFLTMIIFFAVALCVLLVITCYVKAPPSVAYIISGLKSNPRILVGSGGIKIPFIERIDKLYLGQLSVDIKTEQSVPTNDFINVRVDAVAKVMVGDSAEDRLKASRNFLNLNPEGIALSLKDSLEGNMREIIGTLSLKDINTDRDSFSDQVMAKAAADMKKLGIEVISCNIQNVTDENGLIENLGADNTARIRKDASIAKALADRDVAIAQAQAAKEANDAQVASDLEIAKKQNELAIRKAELKKEADIQQAIADAAYKIQEQEQEKSVQEATVNAQIKRAEREAELKKTEVSIKENQLAAEVQKQADADKYAVEKQAEAALARRTREAEAKLIEQQKDAEAIKAKGEAEAAAIRAKGEAEAAAIRMKGEAEAAAMDKKAEAMKKYGDAAKAQMVMEILPQVVAEIAKPMSAIDNVTIIGGGGKDSGISTVSDQVPAILAKTFQSIKATTGVDLAEIMKAETYDAKINRHYTIDGLDKVVSKLTPSQSLKEDPFPHSSNQELLMDICSAIKDQGIVTATTTKAAYKIATDLLFMHGEPQSDNPNYGVMVNTLTAILLNLEEDVNVDDIVALSGYLPEIKHNILSKLYYVLTTNFKQENRD